MYPFLLKIIYRNCPTYSLHCIRPHQFCAYSPAGSCVWLIRTFACMETAAVIGMNLTSRRRSLINKEDSHFLGTGSRWLHLWVYTQPFYNIKLQNDFSARVRTVPPASNLVPSWYYGTPLFTATPYLFNSI